MVVQDEILRKNRVVAHLLERALERSAEIIDFLPTAFLSLGVRGILGHRRRTGLEFRLRRIHFLAQHVQPIVLLGRKVLVLLEFFLQRAVLLAQGDVLGAQVIELLLGGVQAGDRLGRVDGRAALRVIVKFLFLEHGQHLLCFGQALLGDQQIRERSIHGFDFLGADEGLLCLVARSREVAAQFLQVIDRLFSEENGNRRLGGLAGRECLHQFRGHAPSDDLIV